MFCLRSWLPLLFIPTNASPAFIFLFFVCTYFLNRPCVYCSFLLLVLFLTSCNWSDRCFFDFGSNWFLPRPATYLSSAIQSTADGNKSTGHDDISAVAAIATEMLNSTTGALVSATTDQLLRVRTEWTGIGLEWLRSLLGRREWRIECLDLYVRL